MRLPTFYEQNLSPNWGKTLDMGKSEPSTLVSTEKEKGEGRLTIVFHYYVLVQTK